MAPEGSRRGTGARPARPAMSPTRVREAVRRAARYRRTGRLAEARALYCGVLAVRPDHREALKACAVVSLQLDHVDQAVALLRRAVVLDEGDAGAHNDLGNALQAAGRLDEAAAVYCRALALDPAMAEAHLNLGHARRGAGDLDGAAAAYAEAARLRPDHAGAVLYVGLVHHAQGEPESAARAFRRAIALDPKNAEARFALGNALYALDALDDAVRAYEEAAALKADILDASFAVGKPRHVHAHLDGGDPHAAVAACDAYLARHPGASGALAMKAIALRESGDAAAARALLDFDRFLRPVRRVPPAGFASVAAFNEALAAHVRNHPTLRDAPASYSMEGGKSTGELFPGTATAVVAPAVAAFREAVARAVEEYRDALPAAPDHPFVAAAPARFKATAWGVVLDAGAFQVPHIHPSAWLSGVYYVRLPEIVTDLGAAHAGWIEFGRPYWDFAIRVEPETRLVKPEEGLMLLFPSYMFHRTLPFAGPGERISIAFDILRDG